MGYVHDTQMSQFVSPFKAAFTAGTWTPTLAANVVKNVRTAAAAAFTAMIPVELPANAAGLKGARLKSIDVWYKILTADATDFATVELEKTTLTANTVAITGAVVTTTLDTPTTPPPSARPGRAQDDGHPRHPGLGRRQRPFYLILTSTAPPAPSSPSSALAAITTSGLLRVKGHMPRPAYPHMQLKRPHGSRDNPHVGVPSSPGRPVTGRPALRTAP